jgi:hypothetical protein
VLFFGWDIGDGFEMKIISDKTLKNGIRRVLVEVTVAQIEKILGHKVKIVKG